MSGLGEGDDGKNQFSANQIVN